LAFFDQGGTNPLCITTAVMEPGSKYHFEWVTDAWGSDAITWSGVWLIPVSTLTGASDINASGAKAYYIATWTPSRGIGSNTAFNGTTLTSIAAADAWGVGEVLSLDIDMSTIGATGIIAKLDGGMVANNSGLAFNDEPYVVCPQVQSNSANRTWKGTFNFGDRAFDTTPEADHVGISTLSYAAPAPAANVTPLSGSFLGNANVDGPYVWLGYTPDTAETFTINGNAVTWGTHALPMAGGFKVVTSSTSYNNSGSNSYSIAVAAPFGGEGVAQARAG
jgi:hypothetical protein